MTKSLKSEILNLIKLEGLNCTLGEFKDMVDWSGISCNQKLSEEFIREFNLTIDPDNWLYWTDEQKISVIKRYYDIDNEGFIVAWKGNDIPIYTGIGEADLWSKWSWSKTKSNKNRNSIMEFIKFNSNIST